ncbi:MAG: hypothetical protein V7L05_19970 [Nostoc sp.]|uniref:hypothetical protein n=1 Tax=Nostoc sp. TaxID=1180 RepID=UPI002FF8CE26
MFYQPSTQGYEHQIATQVARRREAQLAAIVEGIGVAPSAVPTHYQQTFYSALTYGTTHPILNA